MGLGSIGIILPVSMTFALEFFFGFIILIAGVFQVLTWYRLRSIPRIFTLGIMGTLLIYIGITFIGEPVSGVLTLTSLLIIYLVFKGITEVYLSVSFKGLGNNWWMMNGLCSLALAYLVFSGWPSSAFWSIGLLIGINLFVTGLSLLMVSFSIKSTNANL